MPRIATAGFQHETNTFGATRASYRDFEIADAWPELLTGEASVAGTAGINLPYAGFIDAARNAPGIDVVPILWCSAEPSSHVTDDAFERIAGMILDGIAAAGPVDGVYLDLHGAMVTESHPDGEGELLRRIRSAVGGNLPVVASLDLHANMSAQMVEHASALTLFRTYPHLDMAACGARALAVLKHLLGGNPLKKSFRQLPFLIPLQAQYTGAEPCRSLYGGLGPADHQSFPYAEIAMGFPPADIADAGPSVVAYAARQEAADRLAERTCQAVLSAEPQFDAALLSARDAVAEAMAIDAGRPVVIADVQDNPGAGATSDSTGLLSALVEGKAECAVLALLDDPEVAELAHRHGIGESFSAALGGKSGLPGQRPFVGRFRVEALGDGHFTFTGEMYRGSTAEIGPAAVLRVLDTDADVRMVVASRRCQCVDLAIFRHLDIEPMDARIVIVKSTVHFRADFEPIAAKVLAAEAPGANYCRVEAIPYRNLRPGVRLGPNGPRHDGWEERPRP